MKAVTPEQHETRLTLKAIRDAIEQAASQATVPQNGGHRHYGKPKTS